MSAQAYTNKRRILAEASLLKTVYPGQVGVKNTLAATIDCTQTLQPLLYKDICGCGFDGRGNPPPIVPPSPIISAINGGTSGTGINNVALWISGSTSGTGIVNVSLWIDGGSA
jgi:hypothetical protein